MSEYSEGASDDDDDDSSEEMGSEEESGKDWSDLEREAAEEDREREGYGYDKSRPKHKSSSHKSSRWEQVPFLPSIHNSFLHPPIKTLSLWILNPNLINCRHEHDKKKSSSKSRFVCVLPARCSQVAQIKDPPRCPIWPSRNLWTCVRTLRSDFRNVIKLKPSH